MSIRESSYVLEQLIENEKGWLFYDCAMKTWWEMFQFLVGDKILDIGCGTGISMSLTKVFKPSTNMVGLEGNTSGKELWKVRNLNVVEGDIYNLPFEDNTFDTVYSSHVLEHLDDPQRAIEESIRVTKKRIIHIVPDGNVDDKNHGSPHLHYYNRINFEQSFPVGLKQICYKSIPNTHMNTIMGVYDV